MLKDLNSNEEVKKFFEELENKPMADFHKGRIYGMAKAYQDLQNKEKPVIEYYEKDKSSGKLLETFVVSDEIIIAKEQYKSTKGINIYYVPFVNGSVIHECANSFDFALIIALANKYGDCGASKYAAKVLNMNIEEDD